jgi:long-chain fatty acid transport protein
MNMIGYGAESVAMGGADLALTSSPSAMNINPAGIGRAERPEVSFALGTIEPSLQHTDRLGNDTEDTLERYPMPFVGYVHPAGDFSFGIGLFIQGGMGAEYQGLTTPFAAMSKSNQLPATFFGGSQIPSTDATLTKLAHAKFTPTIAWQALPKLTLGASFNVSYATADMQLFPNTSVRADLDGSGTAGDSPGDFFFGMDGDDMSGVGYGFRLGFQYETGDLALGGSYATETELNLDGGTMTMNLAALGLGKVPYDCEMSGLTWPRQAGLGLAYRVRPRLLIAADLDWVDWSNALSTVMIELDNPAVAGAPPAREVPLRMGWEDQWVWAAGMEFRNWQRWVGRLGFNHGASPVPDAMLRPLFPAIAENHLTGGAGYKQGPWIFDLALEYALETEKTNSSADLSINPFGPGAQESLSQVTFHFMVRRSLFGNHGDPKSVGTD